MDKLKRLFSALGMFQCFFLLVLYLFLYFYKIDILFIAIFIYSLFLGFFIIESRSKYLLANNSALIFILFLFLYGIFNPIIQKVLNGTIDDDIYKASIIYAATIPSFLIGWTLRKAKIPYDISYNKTVTSYRILPFYERLLIIILVGLIAYKTYFFYSIGMLFNPSALVGKSRFDLFENVNQLEVILGLLISSVFLYFIFYYQKINKKKKLLLLSLLFYYIALQLSAGNRRDFMPMFLGVFWVAANIRKLKFNLILFIGLLCGIFFFNYLGTLRSSLFTKNQSKSDVFMITMTSNEFVYPFFTLSFEVDDYLRNNNYQFYYGETIVTNSVLFFIPRQIYKDKPTSLANKFIKKFYGRRSEMGFAYTPASEFFINFGPMGPAICYFFIGLIFLNIQFRKQQTLHFVLFTMILDFCRGEIATFIYQFFFVGFFIIVVPKLKKPVFFNNIFKNQ